MLFYQSASDTIVDEKYLRAHNIELQHNPCVWHPGNPVLYNLNTKLGVNFEADHWFHMSEIFLTKHSSLRGQHRLSNASITFYNYEDKMFVDTMSTRILISLTCSITYLLDYIRWYDKIFSNWGNN